MGASPAKELFTLNLSKTRSISAFGQIMFNLTFLYNFNAWISNVLLDLWNFNAWNERWLLKIFISKLFDRICSDSWSSPTSLLEGISSTYKTKNMNLLHWCKIYPLINYVAVIARDVTTWSNLRYYRWEACLRQCTACLRPCTTLQSCSLFLLLQNLQVEGYNISFLFFFLWQSSS